MAKAKAKTKKETSKKEETRSIPMAEIIVSAGRDKDARKVSLNYPIPETVEACMAEFGEEAVYNVFLSRLKVGIQDCARKMLKEGKTDAEIQVVVDAYRPGVRRSTAATPLDKATKLLGGMSEEDRAALIEKIQNGEL